MTIASRSRLYRGYEIYPLVYPHRAALPGFSRNYEEGFDAAVRISEPGFDAGPTRSRVFHVASKRPFDNAGDARRASTSYAEQLIDECRPGQTFWDQQQ
jgi:hypothetical protein